jgi:hypothetical protein
VSRFASIFQTWKFANLRGKILVDLGNDRRPLQGWGRVGDGLDAAYPLRTGKILKVQLVHKQFIFIYYYYAMLLTLIRITRVNFKVFDRVRVVLDQPSLA